MTVSLPMLRVDGVAIARPAGDLDHVTVPVIERDLVATATAEGTLVLDLTGVGFLDSRALRMLDDLVRLCATRGGALWVVAPPDGAARFTLRVAEFPGAQVAATTAEALQAIARG